MSSHHQISRPLHRLFLDLENVAKVDSRWIARPDVMLHVFVGANQKKVDTDLAFSLHKHANRSEITKVSRPGKNALDFVMASHVGRAVESDPACHVHLISRDKGFDALVKQLRSEGIKAHRHDGFESLERFLSGEGSPLKNALTVARETDVVAKIRERLGSDRSNRPKKKKRLLAYLKSQLGKDTTDQDVKKVLAALEVSEEISITEDNSVIYRA